MRELFMQAVTILFARSFIRIAQLVSFLILARYLSPQGLGAFGLVTTAMGLAAQLGSVGLRQSTAHAIGRGTLTAGEAAGTILAVWPFLAAVASLVVWFFYANAISDISAISSASIIVLGVGAALLIVMNQGVFLGRGDIRYFSFTETAPRVLLTGFVVALMLTNSITIGTALWSYVASFALVIPISLFFVSRNMGQLRPVLAALPGMVVYGVAFSINLFLITLNTRIGLFMLDHFSGQAEAGRFFAALRINEIFIEAAVAFGLVIFSSTVRSEDQSDMVCRNARIACWTFWSFMLLALGIIVAAPLGLTFLLGKEYQEASVALQIMSLGLGPAAATKIVYPTIAGLGKPLFGSVSIGVSLAVNLIVAWFLVENYGSLGVAAALVAAQFALFLGYAFACKWFYAAPVHLFLIPQKKDVQAIIGFVKRH